MHPTLTAIALLSAFAAAQNETCAPGVHMIVARASTEQPGTGIIGAVAEHVGDEISGSDVDAVDYPAVLNPYVSSQTQGVETMTEMVREYAERCPDARMILMGYSQGAHVTADVLCGASEDGFPTTKPLEKSIADKVVAVVLMGDPSHVAGEPYNEGTSERDGMFPRQNTAGCDAVAAKMVSYCDTGDLFCDGGDDVAGHMAYVTKYGDQAAEFVLSLVNHTTH